MIEEVPTVHILGIRMDKHLSWGSQIENCATFASGPSICLLRNLSGYCNTVILRTAHFGLIHFQNVKEHFCEKVFMGKVYTFPRH